MAPPLGLTMQLARRAADWTGAMPPSVRGMAAAALRDTVGCMLAGVGETCTQIARDTAASWGSGPAAVVGAAASNAAPWAAFVNGVAAHALDYDDYLDVAMTHPSAVILPALLAMSDVRGAVGSEVIEAWVAGVEAQIAIGRQVNPGLADRGWHATSTVGTLGAAIACGRLLRLDAERMRHALSLAASMACGLGAQFGTMAKPFHAGFAAKNAVIASTLAEAGVTAAEDALESPMGFMALFGPGARPEVAAGPAEALAIEAVGLTVKLYPCCAATHRTLDGFLALRATYGFAAGDVASITAEVSHTHAACLLYPYPEDPAQARFSMPFVLAIALLRGAPTLADFTASSVQDPALRALLGRTRLIGQPQRAIGDANPHAPAVTTVRLRDGRELHAVTQHPQGTLAQPASAQAVAAKFCDCVATLPSDLAGRLELLLSECSASLDLRALTTILSRASPRAMHATSVNHCRPQMRRGA